MVLRLTKKLADKLKIKSLPENANDSFALDEWYGHLFSTERTQYIIFTSAFSLYSVIFPGKGVTDAKTLLEIAIDLLEEELKKDEVDKINLQKIESLVICKTDNRAILGSINDMISLSKLYLTEDRLTIKEILEILNRTPFSYIKDNSPLKMMKSVK